MAPGNGSGVGSSTSVGVGAGGGTILEQLSHDLAQLHEQIAPGLVQIRRRGRGNGAGCIVRADGLILTNAHVVSKRGQVATDLSVQLADGRELPARVLAMEPQSDLALLQISAPGLTPIRMGDSNQVAPGQVVVAMGFPYGVQGGATLGVVVAPAGELAEQPQRPGQWLAAGLHLRPGHSGGPMVDAEGRLVGINTMMNGPDVGVAVPVQVAKEFLLRVAQAGQEKERERAEAESGVTWV